MDDGPIPPPKTCLWMAGDPPSFDDACGQPTYQGQSYCLAHCHRAWQGFPGPEPAVWSTERMVVAKDRKRPTRQSEAQRLHRETLRERTFEYSTPAPPPPPPPEPEPTAEPKPNAGRFKKRGNKDARDHLPKPGTRAAELVGLMIAGKTDQEIASWLKISRHYVRSLRSKYSKPIAAAREAAE